MLSALFGPALILITGSARADGDRLAGKFLRTTAMRWLSRKNPIGKLVVLAVISLFFWHGAERLFLTLKDMKAGPLPVFENRRPTASPPSVTLVTFLLLLVDRILTGV